MISVTVRLSQLNEALLYRSERNGEYYLNLLLTPEPDKFGNHVVIQPLPKDRYLSGEASPPVGSWKELGQARPVGKGLDLSKYKSPPQPPPQGQLPEPGPATEFFDSPEALDAASSEKPKPPGFDELWF
jgi:hypothetical protein